MTLALLLASGISLLLTGGHYLVRHAVELAARLKVPALVIGLTIVAFTTSLPELITSVYAAVRGYGDVGIGNIMGSCIMNVLAVLGLVLVFGDIPVEPQIYLLDVPVLLLVSLLAVVLLAKKFSIVVDAGAAMIGAPPAFAGVLVALLILLPDSVAAVAAARKNDIQNIINLALVSSLYT